MGRLLKIYGAWVLLMISPSLLKGQESFNTSFEFYNETFNIEVDSSIIVGVPEKLSENYIKSCYDRADRGKYAKIVDSLLAYKKSHELNDWLYYQLIRKTAQAISPKKDNYERYTFYKWFIMIKSGYDARLTVSDKRLIFFVYNDENISDIPFLTVDKKKYMCLNYHDYAHTNFLGISDTYMISDANAKNAFSYKITRMPDFKPSSYTDKKLLFQYGQKSYHFDIKVNAEIQGIFQNYPGVDFADYFNIPLSRETYGSLIPMLKRNLTKMTPKNGVDYLMKFTRYAFLYENDDENFGKEKRLSPEQTLFSEASDCDDRAALFFYLVKEIYDLPMIAMLYPSHITMAVQFDKQLGKPVTYNGREYTVCEPTPQLHDHKMGQLAKKYRNQPFEIVYAYEPKDKHIK